MRDTGLKQRRYEQFIEQTEIPMLVLSVLLIPVVLMPFIEDLSPWSLSVLEWTGVVIWMAFAVEYAALLILSTNRWQTIRSHKLNLVLVLLPFLRPLRLAKVVRLARAGTAFARAATAAGRLLGRPGFSSTIATVGGLVFAGGFLVSIAEHDQPNSTIADVADGIWWAFVTCTTVGYGDEFPVTITGRLVAVILMLAGISGVSVITANIAAYFISTDTEHGTDGLSERLDRIEHQLERLTTDLLDPPTKA